MLRADWPGWGVRDTLQVPRTHTGPPSSGMHCTWRFCCFAQRQERPRPAVFRPQSVPLDTNKNARPKPGIPRFQRTVDQAAVLAFRAAMRSSSGGWLMNSLRAVEPAMPKAAIWVGSVLWPWLSFSRSSAAIIF